ncbi:ankyrin repeat-containing domain protein [Schizothecium vesticola]|uniref:protein S-acyltransferase n=1 Tax=Schizothecium vesticola TaxID=314040 RepID=A0AA40BR13_9PEZI|nr:ankyrin repeat-containing domain protein [Schizothecium vesticola]
MQVSTPLPTHSKHHSQCTASFSSWDLKQPHLWDRMAFNSTISLTMVAAAAQRRRYLAVAQLRGYLAAAQLREYLAGIAAVVQASTQPIHLVVHCGSLRGTKLLVDASPECVHALDGDGLGPAWLAAQGGHADILALLIMHHVELNAPRHTNNRYPIHQAALFGHKKAVELLLQNGADPDPVSSEGITPLWLAAQEGYHEIVEMILDCDSADKKVDLEVQWKTTERRPLHQAAQRGHLKTTQLLLARGAAYDPVDSDGVTPLWLSAGHSGNADLIHELLEAGAKVDVTSYEHNRQPIHQAANYGHVEAVRILLDAGASPTPENDTFDDSEVSPFLLACESGEVELVNLFLDRGVDAHMVSKNGKSALHFAAHGGHVAIGRVLIKEGCDVDAREEEEGWPPMMIAAQEGHLSFVDLLMENNANIDAEKEGGATSLWVAAQQGHSDIVKRLLEAGAKQLSAMPGDRRPIHQAAQRGHLACVKELLKHSPEEINKCDNHGFTALTHASQKNETAHFSVMRYLVSRGAKVIVSM